MKIWKTIKFIIAGDYEEVEQCSIPYLKLGYNSLFHYIRDIKEIKYSTDNCGRPVLVVQDEKVNHLNDLIRNQKPAKVLLINCKFLFPLNYSFVIINIYFYLSFSWRKRAKRKGNFMSIRITICM